MSNRKTSFPKEILGYLLVSVISGSLLFCLLFLGNRMLYQRVIQPKIEQQDFAKATEEFQKFVTEQQAGSYARFTWQSENGAVFYLRNDAQNPNEPKLHKQIDRPPDNRQPLGTEQTATIQYANVEARTIFLVVENRLILYIGTGITALIGLAFACILFYRQLMKKAKYMRMIEKGTIILESGDLAYRIDEIGNDELTKIATSINSMSQSLAEKIESEAKAAQASREIISDLSHDIRTPLTILSGYLPILLDTDLNEEQQKYVQLAHKKTQQMNIRVNDLLEYATIFSGQRPLKLQEVNVRLLLEQFITELLSVTEVDYELKIPEHTCMIGDMQLLERLFDNLISNIHQHADLAQGVAVEVVLNQQEIWINIQNSIAKVDTGMGKSLGVKISTMIVELHHGKMTTKQTEQAYQTELILPLKPSEQKSKTV